MKTTTLYLFWGLIILMIASLFLGCEPRNTADREQARETEAMMAEANSVLGMPAIGNWTEKRLLKTLYELRDQESLPTYTYIVNLEGELIFFCESVGYGMPYSAQYSNPERFTYYRRSGSKLPQPEPNGLFMPEGLSATWVLCIDPEGVPRPVYTEPSIIVSPHEL